jgi:hypothetical protein
MRASELGKVSRDKRRRATTSNDTIAADRDERNRCRSQREAPKPRVTNTSDATREAMATFRLDATGRPCRRMLQESREGVVSITTKLIADDNYRRSGVIAATPVRRNKQEALPQQEASSRSGKYMSLIFYDAIVRINKNKNKQQKQAQPHDTWNARHARNTHSTNALTAQASRPAASGTPSPNNKTSASDNNNSNTILFWWDS